MRNYDNEALDNESRQYRYSVDFHVREFFIQRLFDNGYINKNDKCLEVGSHDGSMTRQLLEIYANVDVLEPAEIFHEKLKSEFGERINLFAGLTYEVDFEKSYDAIFLVHVLEHMENPIEELARLGTWLRNKGKIFVLVPNAHALSRQIAVSMGLINACEAVMPGEAAQGHLRTYSLKQLEQHAEESGLIVLETGGIMTKPLANFQLDSALEKGIISFEYLTALNELSKIDGTMGSSIYLVLSN
ncbi:2-polyprenyl-3-methyl-5-hydroxy-6-metoxy-1,4-benzoquinol methylase [Candidatus Planktophila lacus]|uniref:class I SAM-dependent methyltransferase n=1 Tax=Candidatus Planktophila lacus TaxID=1884913 RepID=UPI000BBF6613|nr:class I SAM-dependent methyltransferase [Candidatus Planktophila lacus]ASY25723.1 2-polyprenyl-3-methyl-5-hydroxy-6-metoxy-1,4-benzoquinol methylase [Candidatus Planktophila lacus]